MTPKTGASASKTTNATDTSSIRFTTIPEGERTGAALDGNRFADRAVHAGFLRVSGARLATEEITLVQSFSWCTFDLVLNMEG